jgi:hypothetical protein
MASYKNASDEMNTSGMGLTETDKSTYQEHIVNDVCKYYFDLLPVLGDRPNIYPHYTNESVRKDNIVETFDNQSDDDNESLFDEYGNRITTSSKVNELIDLRDDNIDFDSDSNDSVFSRSRSTKKKNNKKTNTPRSSSMTTRQSHNTSSTSSSSILNTSDGSPPKKTKTSHDNQHLSPIDARRIQHNLLKKHKLQIHGRKNNSKNLGLVEQESDNRNFLVECRKQKITSEKRRYDFEKEYKTQQMKLNEEKILIDKARLQMEKQQALLIQEKTRAETALNDQKMMLVKLQMFKEREEFKKSHPDISEEYLNTLFPM